MEEYPLLTGKKVLLVDDEHDILDSLEDLLPMCEIKKADNFEAAKHLLENEKFDLAVLDIMGVDGYKLLDISIQNNVIAVMLTAHGLSSQNLVRSIKNGASSYLPKEEMINIASYLSDILESKKEGKNPLKNWYSRLSSFFENRLGPHWKADDKEFWERFPWY